MHYDKYYVFIISVNRVGGMIRRQYRSDCKTVNIAIWYSPASIKISVWNSIKKEREHFHNYFISILYLYEEAFSWESISGLIFMLILFPEDGSFPHFIQVGPIYIR